MLERLSAFLHARRVNFDTFGTVLDIGSRDGLQAIELSHLFPNANVVAVECNAATLDICRGNISAYPRIRLVDKAINSFTGRCAFFPTDPKRTITTWADGNPGASSLFIATGDYPAEKYVQSETEVDCTRLDDLCRELDIDVIDLIWMDLQGAELIALQSAGSLLDKTRYIYTEVSHRPIYQGQCLFDDVNAFLEARGFRLCTKIDRTRWQQDLIYENRRALIDVHIPLHGERKDLAELAIHSVRKCVRNVRHIYVTGTHNPEIRGARFVDPAAFPFDGPRIADILPAKEDVAPYWRQLAKLYMPMCYPGALEDILVVDANTVFLAPCHFTQDGRPIFSFGGEDHGSSIEHMIRLYPVLRKMFAYSATTHCSLMRRKWLQELRTAVETYHRGKPLWLAYLDAVAVGNSAGAASEAEIYFNFALMFHSGDLVIQRLPWQEADSIDEDQLRACTYVSIKYPDRVAGDDLKRLHGAALGGFSPPHAHESRPAPSAPLARNA